MKLSLHYVKLIIISVFIPLVSCSTEPDLDLPPLPEPDPADTMLMPQVDHEIKEFMQKYNLPGLTLTISKNGKIVYAKGYGYADVEEEEKTTTDHLFRIGSVSKTLMGVSILHLMETGALSLDQKVFGPDGILGSEYGSKPYDDKLLRVTVRHLVTHTAGGWVNVGGPFPDPMSLNNAWTKRQIIDYSLDNYPLQYEPGQKYLYSNFGYCLLGRVIEKLTGMTYENYVKTEILKPMGITQMRVGGNSPADRVKNEVVYYGDPGTDPYGPNISRMDASGGWIASSMDLVRFMLHVDGFSTVPDFLTPETIKLMITPVKAEGNETYGYGWRNDQGTWYHAGSVRGGGARITRTTSGYCWAIATNNRSNNAHFFSDMNALIWTAVKNPNTEWPEIDQ